MKDEEITAPRYMGVTVLRVTPLDEDGSPDHQWAMTYHLDEPVMFGIGTVEPLPTFTREYTHITISIRRSIVGALVAEFEHPQYRDIGAIAQGIWQRRRTGVAVEGWAEYEPGTWWYAIVPWWRYMADPEQWPLKELPEHRAYALGECLTVDGYAWPEPGPFPSPHNPSPGTQLVMGVTNVVPPAPGFPPFPGAAA
ncbi:hypothetical protein [Streptomyces prunicolor]|uniref:hypothetical protein n=1 Tax=Streptomyces prunicolor TaxID=67348 RepID=UPI000368CCAA|nr:hypothetical protein [Streptomyces prunicolor]